MPIHTGNYGFIRNDIPHQRECSDQIITRGDSKSDVLAKCGEPNWKDAHEKMFGESLERGIGRKQFAKVEEWTYNLGAYLLSVYSPSETARLLISKPAVTDMIRNKEGRPKFQTHATVIN